MRAKNKLFTYLLCFLAALQLSAQGWERTYGNSKTDQFEDLIQLNDGGYILVGTFESLSDTGSNVWLIRTDPDGNQEWEQSFGTVFREEFGHSVRSISSGGYILGGTSLPENNERGYLIRTDITGNLVWEILSSQDSVRGEMAIPLSDGGFALAGSQRKFFVPGQTSGDAMDRDGFLMKVDSAGEEIYSKTFGGAAFDEFYSIIELPNGDFVMGGITHSFGNCFQVFVVKTDANGNTIWEKNFGDTHDDIAYSMILSDDETELILAGTHSECGVSNTGDVLVLKIDLDGNELDKTIYQEMGHQIARSVQETNNGGLIITGSDQIGITGDRDLFLKKIENTGTWTKNYGGSFGEGGYAVLANASGGFTATGWTRSFGNGKSDAYLILTDAEGVSLSSVIYGEIDFIQTDCGPDNPQSSVADQIVKIEGPETYFAVTDENGEFSTHVVDGTYEITLVSLSDYWSFCYPPVPQTVAGSALGIIDTASIYLTLKPEVYEPLMKTDIAVNHLRPGFQSTYTVTYCNIGALTGENVTLDITLDEFLEYDTSSIPYIIQNGNTFTYFLDDIDVFECGEFQIFTTLDSTVALGQTHCTEAHIYPDSLIYDNPDWDKASIELNAVCDVNGDSIYFEIHNHGAGDMLQQLEFIIIEDQIIGLQGNYQLGAGESETIAIEATGGTFRMQADQSPYHPFESKPSIAVEGCGGAPFSTGYVIDFPENDASPFVDIDCRENRGSYDPNDKQAFPKGWDEAYFIEANTDIEYLIRFQNEGTDTAFRVVIRDTLSQWLDPATIIPGSSSHPYTFSVYGHGIIKFTFEDILLPHKGIDSLGSMGFVKFRIKQKPNNPLGTEIYNTAAIYFDYNAPVITEPIFHTIGELIGTNSVDDISESSSFIKIYPNPFSEFTTFEVENQGYGEFTFSVFDLQGQLIQTEKISESKFQFVPKNILSGMYFYKVEQKGKLLHSGKIIIQK